MKPQISEQKQTADLPPSETADAETVTETRTISIDMFSLSSFQVPPASVVNMYKRVAITFPSSPASSFFFTPMLFYYLNECSKFYHRLREFYAL